MRYNSYIAAGIVIMSLSGYAMNVSQNQLEQEWRKLLDTYGKFSWISVQEIKSFLEAGANVDEQEKGQVLLLHTALMNAAIFGRLDLVRMLIEEEGADRTLRGGFNKETAEDMACRSGHQEVVNFLSQPQKIA